MAIPFGALRGAARRGLFRQYAQARWAPGITAQTILNETRAIGLAIRRTDALSIIREMAGREVSRSVIRFVPGGNVPSMRMYAETRLRLGKRFQTIFEASGRDLLTREMATRRVSFASDERVTMEQMEQEMKEKLLGPSPIPGAVTDFKLVAVEGLVRAEPPFTEES